MNSVEQPVPDQPGRFAGPAQALDLPALAARQPEFLANKSSLVELAYEEYCRRREAGEKVDPDQFCQRFPAFQTSLRRLLEADRFFEDNPDLLRDFEPISWPEPGQEYLGFALVRELGRGAFARVYLATQPSLGNRLVAVKVSLHGSKEAETLGRINHPNIVPVHSVQEDAQSGLTVVCMPYLGTATLCDVLDHVFARPGVPASARALLEAVRPSQEVAEPAGERRPPHRLLQRGTYIDGVLHLAVQLADALAFIHARGICHRDLKPSNVLVTSEGRPMLLDFNLSFDQQTAEHKLGGTLPYMSPEQLLATDLERPADPTLLDARSDLYSLGVLLHELLTGRHPFGPVPLKLSTRELRQLLLDRQRAGARPLRQGNPQVERPLARTLERCLAYNPQDRPQTATELARALRQGLSWRRRGRRWLAQHVRAVFLACVLLVLATLAGGYLFMPRGTYSERQWRQGVESYKLERYPEAIEHYNRALVSESEFVPALFARGRAHQRQGSLELALADYQRAAQLLPDGQIKACQGYCLSRLRLHREAIRVYQEALTAGCGTAEVFNNLGCSQLQLGQLDPAQQSLDEAVRLNERLQAAYHNRARLDRQRMTRLQGYVPRPGIADIEKAIALGPPSTELYFDAAYLHAFAAKIEPCYAEAALKYLERAIDLGQDSKPVAQDPTFAALAGRPEFQALLKRTAAREQYQPSVRFIDPVHD